VRVQLLNSDPGGPCWEATYSTPLVNDILNFKARPD